MGRQLQSAAPNSKNVNTSRIQVMKPPAVATRRAATAPVTHTRTANLKQQQLSAVTARNKQVQNRALTTNHPNGDRKQRPAITAVRNVGVKRVTGSAGSSSLQGAKTKPAVNPPEPRQPEQAGKSLFPQQTDLKGNHPPNLEGTNVDHKLDQKPLVPLKRIRASSAASNLLQDAKKSRPAALPEQNSMQQVTCDKQPGSLKDQQQPKLKQAAQQGSKDEEYPTVLPDNEAVGLEECELHDTQEAFFTPMAKKDSVAFSRVQLGEPPSAEIQETLADGDQIAFGVPAADAAAPPVREITLTLRIPRCNVM